MEVISHVLPVCCKSSERVLVDVMEMIRMKQHNFVTVCNREYIHVGEYEGVRM